MSTHKAEALRIVTACHLATTDTPATPHDSAYIRGHLEAIQKEKIELQNQLKQIQRRIEELEHEYNFFKLTLSSPIRRIPLEILGEIFAWVLHESNGQATLVKLCQVSKTWRDAAHIVPRFWQRIAMDAARLTPLSYEAISSWLARSKKLPRALHLSAQECGNIVRSKENGEEHIRTLCAGAGNCLSSNRTLAKILKSGPSLNTILIRCPTPQCFQNLSMSLSSFNDDPTTSSWNSTSSVWISADWDEEWTSTSLTPSTLCFLPREVMDLGLQLPHLSNFRPGVNIYDMKIEIPASVLQSLTSFNLNCSWTASHILPLLQHCTNLRFLRLDLELGCFERWDEDDAFMQSIAESGIVLPNLQTLFLEHVHVDSVEDLPLLQLPALRELSIVFGNVDWHPDTVFTLDMTPSLGSAFSHFLKGSIDTPSTLESLMISNGIFLEDTLLEALKHLDSLKHLIVCNAIFDTETFSEVSSRSLLPQLQTLDLWALHHGHDDIVGIQEFVEKRGITFSMSRCTDPIFKCGD